MQKYTIHVVLLFRHIEGQTLDDACELTERWCKGVFTNPDSVRSYGYPERQEENDDTETKH